MASMTIHPLVQKGAWLLGRDRVMVSRQTSFGQCDRNYEYDGFWDGDKWRKRRTNAIFFRTEDDALAYIEGNFTRMDV